MSAPIQYYCSRLSSLSYSYSYSYSAPFCTCIENDAFPVSIETTRTNSPPAGRNGLGVHRLISHQGIFSWSSILAPFEYGFECRPGWTEYEYDRTAADGLV